MRARGSRPQALWRLTSSPKLRPILLLAFVLTAAAAGLAMVLEGAGGSAAGVPWSRLGTRDVHSLRFVDAGSERLLFGHHDGVLITDDGGRAWKPLPFSQDAMGLGVAADGSIVVAGHLVFQESRDGGRSWAPIRSDLPSLDIHGFARSRSHPDRMWAYLAEGGVYESADGGAGWTRVFGGHVLHLTTYDEGVGTILLGIDPFTGLVTSDDGGRAWRNVSEPPTSPVTSMGATPDGGSLVLGGPDGLYRSDDGGLTWRHVLESATVLAVAISDDAATLVGVTEDTHLYRSDDGGATWPGPER